jgi:hypothetical protein
MSTPAPGSVFGGSSVTFTWFFGAGSAFWLDVGNAQGHGDIFAANVGLATTQTVNGIPTDGRTIFVRLWTLQSGGWVFHDYVYTAATILNTKAVMLTPAPGSTFPGSTVGFTWTAIGGASAYWLDVGTVQGQGNIFAGNLGLVTSQTVSGIPASGAIIYVRLWTQISGIWQFNDYTYISATLDSKAVLISPTPGSILSGTTFVFSWSAGSSASAYWLDVGTVQGQGNIFARNLGLATSQTVSGIPATGGTVFVRLWTLTSGVWQFNDYTYTAAALGSKAFITSPGPGSTLNGSTVTFTWFPGSAASAYWLDVGTVQGQGNIFGNNVGSALSQTVFGIPTNGSPIYVRLWTQISGVWQFNDYTYTAFH